MRKTGLVVIAVVVATALLVGWLSGEAALPPSERAAAEPAAPSIPAVPASAAPSIAPETEVRIEGQVVGAELREGVPGATVDLEHDGQRTAVEAGRDGRFVFTTSEAGTWLIVGARAPHFAQLRQWQRQLELAPGGVATGIEIELVPSRARPVRVVDVAGIPLEGALLKTLGPEGGAVVLTDEAGAAEVELGARDTLEASHPCCVTAEVRPGEGKERFVITLQPAGPIERVSFGGVVVDEDGRVVPGASVAGIAASPALRTAKGFSVTTDSTGRFSVDVPAKAFVEVRATLADSASDELETQAEEEVRLVLLAPEGAVSGRVVDGAGAPVTNFKLSLGGGTFSRELTVDSPDGTWRIAGVPRLVKGMVWVTAVGFLRPPPRKIEVSRRQELHNLDFVMHRGRTISGLVFDQHTNQPLPHALVKMVRAYELRLDRNGRALTDASGRFELTGLPAEPLELRATRGGYQSFTVQVGAQSPPELRIGLIAASSEAALKTGSYEGVGMKFANGKVPEPGAGYLVAALHPAGGAVKAGVRVGDEILAASGLLAGSTPTAEFLREIKGPSGSVVALTVRRGGQTIELNAVRGRLSAW